jgi:hypothetical protein
MLPAVRSAVRAVAPHGAVVLYDAMTFVDLDPVQLLRTSGIETLSDPERLEDVIARTGLAGFAPTLVPARLKPFLDQGLQSVQWPNQLAPYLTTLARYPIARYAEIGVLHGGTFITTVEYLNRFHPIERAWAVDLVRSFAVHRYQLRQRKARMVRARSGDAAFRRRLERWRPDLVLIDGDHAYASVKADFECVHGIANAISFHDITDNCSPGVGRFWRELREQHAATYDFAEITDQYDEVTETMGGGSLFGIGLAVRKGFGPPLHGA